MLFIRTALLDSFAVDLLFCLFTELILVLGIEGVIFVGFTLLGINEGVIFLFLFCDNCFVEVLLLDKLNH